MQPFVTEIRTLESEENRSCLPENKTNGQFSDRSIINDIFGEFQCSKSDPFLEMEPVAAGVWLGIGSKQ